MLGKRELIRHCTKAGLDQQAIKYVLRTHKAAGPSRSPSGKFNAVHDVVACRKMAWTVDSEARATELPFTMHCEYAPSVLAVYAQPPAIKTSYRNAKNRKVTLLLTFDFLVVTTHGVYLIECKKVDDLKRLVSAKPELFQFRDDVYHYCDGDGVELDVDIPVRVSTDRDYKPAFTRNCSYLYNFLDDFLAAPPDKSNSVANWIKRAGNRVLLKELQDAFGLDRVIHQLLAGRIFIDFDNDLLLNTGQTWVYHNKTHLQGLQQLKADHDLYAISSSAELQGHTRLWWKEKEWELLNNSSHGIHIRSDDRTVELARRELEELIQNQDIYVQLAVDSSYQAACNTLFSHSSDAIEAGIERLAALETPGHPLRRKYSDRSLRRMRKVVKEAIKAGVDPVLALIPNDAEKGNRNSRLEPDQLSLIDYVIKSRLEKPSPGSRYSAYLALKTLSEQRGIPCCSLKTFYEHVNSRDKYTLTKIQKGFKAAYALGPQPYEIDLDWDLPYHGDFFMEIAHVDHTPLEITLRSALDGEIINDTLQLSILMDGYSRTILAFWVSFEKPSYRSTMMLLRECYRRYKRLPIFIATDQGPDFQSHYFSRTLAALGIHHRNRPTARPRHGSSVERLFGVAETELVHTLEGNEQLQKLGRGLSPTHKPALFAELTPDEFYDRFAEYVYIEYPGKNRRGISERPEDRRKRSVSQFDSHPGLKVVSDQTFYIATMPEPKEKDGYRTINKNQIEFRGINYLLTSKIPDYHGQKTAVKIKYEPYDPRFILARFSSRWVKLTTNDHLVRECYDKGIRFPHLEVLPRKSRDGKRYRQGPAAPAASYAEPKEREKQALREKYFSPGKPEPETPEPRPVERFSFNFNAVEAPRSTTTPKGSRHE